MTRVRLLDTVAVRGTLVARAGEVLSAEELGERLSDALRATAGAVEEKPKPSPAGAPAEAQAPSGPAETTAPAGPGASRRRRGPPSGA